MSYRVYCGLDLMRSAVSSNVIIGELKKKTFKCLNRTDLLTVYKILFSLLNTSTDVFFTLRAQAHLRGHPYTLDKQRCTNSVRQSFL